MSGHCCMVFVAAAVILVETCVRIFYDNILVRINTMVEFS